MLAAITRTYTDSVPMEIAPMEPSPYVRNQVGSFPETVTEYILHAKNWKRAADCPSMVYEYHFWIHQYRDPGMMEFSKLIYDDIRGYHSHGFDGIIEDGSQRSFFPNGFNFFVYAETLFDTGADYDKLKQEYFTHAYGEIADKVIEYLQKITDSFGMKYIMGTLNAIVTNNLENVSYFDPERKKILRWIKDMVAEYRAVFEEHKNMPYRAQTVAMRLIRLHLEYCSRLSEIWVLKAAGKDKEAVDAFKTFMVDFGKYEVEIERYFDQRMCFNSFERIICSPKTFYSAD